MLSIEALYHICVVFFFVGLFFMLFEIASYLDKAINPLPPYMSCIMGICGFASITMMLMPKPKDYSSLIIVGLMGVFYIIDGFLISCRKV